MARITRQDLARVAGVSSATVDRVLNERPGVRPETVQRVRAAVSQLGYQPSSVAAHLALKRSQRLQFILPSGTNTFMQMLAHAVEEAGNRLLPPGAHLALDRVDVFDPLSLARRIGDVAEAVDALAVVALDHPAVREAIDAVVSAGVAVVTLVSDAPSSRRSHYVGINNMAAGRTAGSLLGRFVGGRPGKVALLAGSTTLRDHAERQFGFEQVIRESFSHLTVLPLREGRDDHRINREIVGTLLDETPDLVGLYNIGAGNRGVSEALVASQRATDVVYVAHELTPYSRADLVSGVADALISQDCHHEARSAMRILMASLGGDDVIDSQERIRIDIFVGDNLP